MPITRLPHLVAALLGVTLGRRLPSHRPMAGALAALFALDVGRQVCQWFRPNTLERIAAYLAGIMPPPYVGGARVSWAAEQAFTVSWYVVLSWAVWEALRVHRVPRAMTAKSTRRGKIVAASAALVFLAIQFHASYPTIRGRAIEVLHVIVFAFALAIQCAAATLYAIRWKRPTVSQLVALILVVGSIADLIGAMLYGRPVRDASVGEPSSVLVWAAIAGVETWALVAGQSARSSSSG